MLISVIIPCYNEERAIVATLTRVIEYLKAQVYDSEIIVVDNGSRDRTRNLVAEIQARMQKGAPAAGMTQATVASGLGAPAAGTGISNASPAIKLMFENSHGKGWAVKCGMLEAKGDFKLFTDADNSTDIAHLGPMLALAQSGTDVVISSRRLPESNIAHPQPWYRQILGNIFAAIIRVIMPLGVKDTQNGFKLFSRAAADKIFPQQRIYYWAFDVEILALARKFGFTVKEVPITWINNDKSSMTLKGMIRMLFEVVIIRFNLATGEFFKGKKERGVSKIETQKAK